MSNDFTAVHGPTSRRSKISFERERGVYAIQVTRDVAHALVSVEGDDLRTDAILKVFTTLTDVAVPIFLIKLHRTAVTFALAQNDVAQAEQAFAAAGFQARTRRGLAMVALKAGSMRDVPGVMVDIGDALYQAEAQMYATGDSHDSVQCLIEADRVDAVVERLCAAFQLDARAVRECPLEPENAV